MKQQTNPSNSLLDPSKATIFSVLAVIASATLFFYGTGLHPVWWLMWFACVPVLLLSPRIDGWRTFLAAALAYSFGSLNMWHYLRTLIGVPIVFVVLNSVIPACIFGLAALAFRAFLRRGAIATGVLAFPVIWVSFEYISELLSPHSTFGNLGYSQMDCLPLLQIVSLTGIWGISFCLLLFAATCAAILSQHGTDSQRLRVAIAAGAFFACILGYGEWRLISASPTSAPSQQTVKVGLMGTGIVDLFPQTDDDSLKLLQAYSEKVTSLVTPDTQVVILPEKIAVVSDAATEQVDELFESVAARTKTYIVIGIDRGTATRRWNEARMYSPQGTLAAAYDKHHMIPRLEDVDQRGTALSVMKMPSGTWGIEICKDMDFPQLSRENGAKGVALLLVPAWDFTVDGWAHGRMAVMRGVESGFAIARAAKQGLLTVSDNRGRILSEADDSAVKFSSLFTGAPVVHDNTIYLRFGDWFAWLNLGALIVIFVMLLVGRKRSSLAT
jgi:apolipoprotein N-acyltransferase